MTRELVYGRRPVREVLRGPREVLELWASERAVRSEAWLRDVERPRVQTKLERDLSDAASTRDHQGVVAWCEPFRYADAFELAGGEAPLLACLDQVSDPRNLGAVLRSAEGAGASGVIVTAIMIAEGAWTPWLVTIGITTTTDHEIMATTSTTGLETMDTTDPENQDAISGIALRSVAQRSRNMRGTY